MFPDLETAVRAFLAPPPSVAAVLRWGEGRVRAELRRALGRFESGSGEYRLHNRFLVLVADRDAG